MATGINAIHLSGTIIVTNNTFINNAAITQNHVFIGSGVGIQISGSMFTIVGSQSNLYLYNQIEYAGKTKKFPLKNKF